MLVAHQEVADIAINNRQRPLPRYLVGKAYLNEFTAIEREENALYSPKGKSQREKKESPKTATQTKSVNATVISDDYGAKIGKLKDIYNSRHSKRTRGFITDVSRTLNLEQHEASHYRTFSTPLGDVTLRISSSFLTFCFYAFIPDGPALSGMNLLVG